MLAGDSTQVAAVFNGKYVWGRLRNFDIPQIQSLQQQAINVLVLLGQRYISENLSQHRQVTLKDQSSDIRTTQTLLIAADSGLHEVPSLAVTRLSQRQFLLCTSFLQHDS